MWARIKTYASHKNNFGEQTNKEWVAWWMSLTHEKYNWNGKNLKFCLLSGGSRNGEGRCNRFVFSESAASWTFDRREFDFDILTPGREVNHLVPTIRWQGIIGARHWGLCFLSASVNEERRTRSSCNWTSLHKTLDLDTMACWLHRINACKSDN